MSSSQANMVKKKNTQGKRKIEIKKVEQSNKRNVLFCKRKQGLFNKVTELSILCEAETALILSSQNGKLFACGYPNPDAVIRRFLSKGSPQQRPPRAGIKEQQESVETLRVQHEALQNHLKEEKKYLLEIKEAHENKGFFDSPPWWNNNIENMGLEDLEDLMASLEHLKLNLVAAEEGKRFNPMSHIIMPLAFVPPPPTYPNLPLFNGCFTGDQACNWRTNGDSSASNSMVPKFDLGPYY